jgi:hypothetical protein
MKEVQNLQGLKVGSRRVGLLVPLNRCIALAQSMQGVEEDITRRGNYLTFPE